MRTPLFDSPDYDNRVALIAERVRPLQPHLPDDDEDPLPRFDEHSDQNKRVLVAEYTDKFGPGWVDDAFSGLTREQLLAGYSQGRDAFMKLLFDEFERFAGELIDRAINNGEIDV